MKSLFSTLALIAVIGLMAVGCASTGDSSQMASSEIEAELDMRQQAAKAAAAEEAQMDRAEQRELVDEYRRLNREI